jgi:hypothetical protein
MQPKYICDRPGTDKIRRNFPIKMLLKQNNEIIQHQPQKYHQPVYINDC